MKAKTKVLIAAVAVAAAGIGAGVAVGAGDDDALENEQPISGSARERAAQVALDHVGEGRVTDTEQGDEESYYEVEVTKDNGDQVDVQLDEDFNVVGEETDKAGEDEAGE